MIQKLTQIRPQLHYTSPYLDLQAATMVYTSSNTLEVKVSAKRMWLGFIEDAHNCLPKCAGDKVASIEYDRPVVEAGCVRTIKTHHHGHVKERFEEVDKEKLKVKISVIEGGFLHLFKHYKMILEFKEAAHAGSCTLEGTIEYESEKEQELPEEVKEGMLGAVKAVEAYLIANPDVYA